MKFIHLCLLTNLVIFITSDTVKACGGMEIPLDIYDKITAKQGSFEKKCSDVDPNCRSEVNVVCESSVIIKEVIDKIKGIKTEKGDNYFETKGEVLVESFDLKLDEKKNVSKIVFSLLPILSDPNVKGFIPFVK
jgi:hypothetical protein